jgi:hypothetical protein
MAKVNPPPTLRIPQAFLADREIRAFIQQQNQILFQLYNRTGGVNDAIEESQQDITSSSSRVSRNAAKINSLELKDFVLLQTLVSVTTEGNQIIACYNVGDINVTLDPQAIEEDEVHIKRRGDGINVIGLIDGLADRFINVPNYSMHLFFTGTEWIEI